MGQYASKTAVSLLSGGLDSTAAMLMAIDQGITVKLCLTIDYGQRAAAQEIKRARTIAAQLGLAHNALSLPWYQDIHSSSALVNSQVALPQPTASKLVEPDWTQESAKAVWVPNRNGVLIEMAAAFAESLQCDAVIVGFNREEAETFPDNRPEYRKAINDSLKYSTQNAVQVISPTETQDKKEILEYILQRDFSLTHLWSCYEGADTMCGRCESCQRLKRAMALNGVNTNELFEHTL